MRDLRNIEMVEMEPSIATNVLCGDNGQGKTSILEAIYLVATTRSFRTHRLREVIRHGVSAGSVRATLADPLGTRQQLVGLASGKRRVRIDEQKPQSTASYAIKTPVVVFHPGELRLTMGPASGRRTLIDRVALFDDATSHDSLRAYTRAMRARQRLLQRHGVQAPGVEAYEQLMVRSGIQVTHQRQRAVAKLIGATCEAFRQIAPRTMRLEARYAPGGSEDEAEAVERLFELREADSRRAGAHFGPHRDDLVFELNGRKVRTDASQGQHRLLILSLKIAEMACIGAASGTNPLLLLDDVSSELDSTRTEAFFALLGLRRDQVFLTTTRPEMLPIFERQMGRVKLFRVRSGCVERDN
ncbi:MAG: DNA replication and repair protein RecF [Sorangium cellulosum]|nr:MAG: DNA replication and repair protein RecF [Sorangium cellulosum]